MEFSKEYIKECECKEIQELRKETTEGDHVLLLWGIGTHAFMIGKAISDIEEKPYFMCIPNCHPGQFWYERKEFIWLPTGDQLDEDIVKICEEKKWRYEFTFNLLEYPYYAEAVDNEETDEDGSLWIHYSENSDNPLTAKIKLLKALLEKK